MEREEVRAYVNQYCALRDTQYAAYELCARKHGLTAKELFVLDIIWFAPEGCLQSEICERLSATRQTISAIVKKFWKLGYLSLTEAEYDRRNKIIRFTDAGAEYAKTVIHRGGEGLCARNHPARRQSGKRRYGGTLR